MDDDEFDCAIFLHTVTKRLRGVISRSPTATFVTILAVCTLCACFVVILSMPVTRALTVCQLRKEMIVHECHALSLHSVALHTVPSGSADVVLDVRQYGSKKVSGVIPRQRTLKIVVVTACVGLDFCDIARQNFEQYTKCHGYELQFATASLDSSRSHHWNKILLMQQALHQGADFVFWMDSDSLFMEQSVSLETFITSSSISLWVEADLNTGHILAKNTPWAKQFLTDWFDTYPSPKPWNDQSSLMYLLGGSKPICRNNLADGGLACYAEVDSSFRRHVGVLDRRLFSSYVWEYEEGDFVVHFPGMEGEKRDLMEKYANQAALFGVVIKC